MAGSAFDLMQKTVFQTAQNLFGFDAVWISEGTTYTCKVLFRNPTEIYKLGNAQIQFDPYRYEMEYKDSDFPGLKELSDQRGNPETVTIDGVDYHVRNVDTLFDGKTFRATLQPVSDL